MTTVEALHDLGPVVCLQERLQQIDSQQREMLSAVKRTLQGLETERVKLTDTFKKVTY